jgi:hypothetical protein
MLLDDYYTNLDNQCQYCEFSGRTFSKSRKGSGEEGKHLGQICCKPKTALGGVVKASLSDQRQNEIIDRGHHLADTP